MRPSSRATASRSAPFCGPKTAVAPAARAAGCRRPWRRRAPTLARRSRMPGARASRSPRPPSFVAEPPSPMTTRRAPLVDRRFQQWRKSGGRRALWITFGIHEQVQPDRLGALDVRRAVVDQQLSSDRTAQRVRRRDGSPTGSAERGGQNRDEPGSPVRHGQLHDRIPGAPRVPAAGDGRSCRISRHGAGELVRRDHHSRHSHTALRSPAGSPLESRRAGSYSRLDHHSMALDGEGETMTIDVADPAVGVPSQPNQLRQALLPAGHPVRPRLRARRRLPRRAPGGLRPAAGRTRARPPRPRSVIGSSSSATTTSATRSSSSPTSRATRSSSPRPPPAGPHADYIVFCGVHFMAESADILTADTPGRRPS